MVSNSNYNRYRLFISAWILMAFFMGGTELQAQRQDSEEVQAFMVAFYTKRLKLTPDEAKGFWPIHEEFSTERKKAQRGYRRKLADIMDGVSTLSDSELEKMGDEFIDLKQKEFDVVKKYHKEFKKVLPIRKVLMLYRVEQEYKKALLDEIRRRRQERLRNKRQ